MAVKWQKEYETFVFNQSALPPVVSLNTTNYASGTVVRGTTSSGMQGFWTSKKSWTAQGPATATPDDYPDYWLRGWAYGHAVVPNGFSLYRNNATGYLLWAVQQTEDNGATWTDRIRMDTTRYLNTPTTLTGDNDGKPLFMRAVLLETDAGMSIDTIKSPKNSWNVDSGEMVTYFKIQYCWSDGKIQVEVRDTYGRYDKDNFEVMTTTNWDMQAFRQQDGYPGLVTYYGGRLVFAGTERQPQSLWLSGADDLTNFKIGTKDADAMFLTLASTQQSVIRWMESQKKLYVGTVDNEWVIGGDGQTNTITPTSKFASRDSEQGGEYGLSLMVQGSTIYIERGGCGRGHSGTTGNVRSGDPGT